MGRAIRFLVSCTINSSGKATTGLALDGALLNTLRPRQNGRHFTDDRFKHIFLNENVCISVEISLKCVPKGPMNNMPALVQIMAWRRPGDKPLSGPMMVSSLTHICVTRPQWVKLPQMLALLVHSMSRSQLYLADSSFFLILGLWLNWNSSVEITVFLLADILFQHGALLQY